jgi:hypothetical protein
MLASPLYPTSSFAPQLASDDHSQFRPARDIEAFNNLLPPPIEFVEGSSSGALAVAEGKYEPINATPKASQNNVGACNSSIKKLLTWWTFPRFVNTLEHPPHPWRRPQNNRYLLRQQNKLRYSLESWNFHGLGLLVTISVTAFIIRGILAS